MIPDMIGKLAPNSTHSTRGLVKYVPGRGYFRTVSSQNGDKFVTSPPPPIVERVASLVQAATPLAESLGYIPSYIPVFPSGGKGGVYCGRQQQKGETK